MIMQKKTVIALFFQVLDQDFVADTVCYADKDCQAPNARFLEKCEAYRDCGNSSQPFRCDLKFNRCLSVRQFRNCKLLFEFYNYDEKIQNKHTTKNKFFSFILINSEKLIFS